MGESATNSGPEVEAPPTLGKYTLLARIGQGGMAEIFLARQAGPRGFERLCALKTMKEMSAGADEHDEMFLDEARIAAQLSHPNIVQIFDFGEEEGRLFIAMEYLAGETLGAVLRKGAQAAPFPQAFAVYVVSAAASALAYAHAYRDMTGRSLNIVHRDISPDNLFITFDGAVKVLDFGIAKAAHRSSQTAAGLVKGKIGYMSPEQLQGRELDGRSDVFALGMVLYEALVGQHPFQKKTQPALEYLTGKVELIRPRSIDPLLPQELEDIILGAVARDRDERIHSAAELQRMLEAWLRTQDGVTPAALAGWMQESFAERRAERVRILEQVLTPGVPARAAAVVDEPAGPDTRQDIEAQPPPAEMQAVSPPLGGSAASPQEKADVEPEHTSVTEPEGEPASRGDATVVARVPGPPPGERPPAPSESTVRAALPESSSVLAAPPSDRPPERSLTDAEIKRATARPRWPVAVGLGALVLLVGGGALLLSRDSGPKPPVADTRPAPAPPAVKASFTTLPEHAAISVDGADRGQSPLSLDLAPGKHRVVARADGFEDATQDVDAKPGAPLAVQLALVARPRAAEVAVAVPDAPAPEAEAEPARSEPHPRVHRAPGKLTLDTVPWSSVYEGGRKLGDTPLFQVSLSAGLHALRLVNAQQKLEKRLSVLIKPNQVTARRVNLK